MSDIAIRAAGLSKLYRIGSREKYYTLRDTLVKAFKAPFQAFSANGRRSADNYVWALKDVSLEVKRGEVVGIIGRNGAGKTTLLKILCRITEPTEGCVEIHGRVGSLLEVGTGFHPELTGRENVYLNGAILGMKKHEIERRFDEIVAFAEVEKFIDTPVKHYSSGMYMRLAFAVAAHLEPEILLVDEVLAVGDAEFQKKSLGKMGDVAKEGRTVLFVSHNMQAINRLCPKAIWLDEARIRMMGPSEELISNYLTRQNVPTGQYICREGTDHPDGTELLIQAVRIRNSNGMLSATLDARKPFYIEIDYEVFKRISLCWVGFLVSTLGGIAVFATTDADVDSGVSTPRGPGTYTSVCTIPSNLLNFGHYTLSVWAAKVVIEQNEILGNLENVLAFDVVDPEVGSHLPGPRIGVIRPRLDWQVRSREYNARSQDLH
jgi:lipopolysaccharide transport system ATP-binding protein